MGYSITYIGVIVMFISKIMDMSGVQISNEEITKFIETGLVIFGGLLAFWGRWRLGKITIFGIRK